MKQFKKVISGVVCASIMLANMPFAYANDAATQDVQWNYNVIEPGTETMYAEFPLVLDKVLDKDMTMHLSMDYVKTVDENHSVTVTVTDAATNSVAAEKELSADDVGILMENVPNDKTYYVDIDETINGVTTEYTGYITTEFKQADFPVNITLGDNEISNNNGETFDNIKIKKVGDNPVCNHSDNEECTQQCSMSYYVDVVEPDALDTLYASLDEDAYYEMQMDASMDGSTQFCRGYISTYADGEQLGIFTRGFTFSQTMPVMILSDGIVPYAYTPDVDTSNLYKYEEYTNVYMNNFSSSQEYSFKFIPPVTGSYIIETIGNADTTIYMYTDDNGTPVYRYRYETGGTGDNARATWSWLINDEYRQVFYFVVTCENSTAAPAAFRIIPEPLAEDDDYTNYYEDLKTAAAAGNYSDNTISATIDYNGDVDMFVYDCDAGEGHVEILADEVSYGDYSDMTQVVLYTVVSGTPFDTVWLENTYIGDGSHLTTFSNDLYYVDVRKDKLKLPTYSNDNDEYYANDEYDYTLKVYPPKVKDSYEYSAGNSSYPNNSPVYASPIELTTQINDTLTLHKGDSDYFTFTTENDGGDLTVTVDRVVCTYGVDEEVTVYKQYEIELISDADVEIVDESAPSWTEEITTTSTTANGKATLTYSSLEPNQKYYIVVRRPNSSTYDSMHTYNLSVNVETPTTYSAVLSDNVQLTHTVGESITSLEAFKSAIMESLTCYINDTAVSDTEAIDDVVLYQGGNELTAAMVSVMAANDYAIDVKYNGVAVTGGTVTLTVSEAAAQNRVEVDISAQECGVAEYDCFHCAKILANYRLASEGSPATTLTEEDAAIYFNYDPEFPERVSLYKTLQATGYFYNNGQSASTSGFSRITNSAQLTEENLYSRIANNKIVIMQLSNASAASDVNQMRYLIVCGVDLGTHQLKIYDCNKDTNKIAWYDTSLFTEGGYVADNSNIKFNGSIVETATTAG